MRDCTSAPNCHQTAADPINAKATSLARRTLATTGGRETYSWEGNGIGIGHDGARRYRRRDGSWSPRAQHPSNSGTGLMNLQLDHFIGCDHPVVAAKRELAFMLLDPTLDVVGWVIANNRSWHGLASEQRQHHDALRIRLSEIIEQKVLENPAAGLSLREIASGAPIVGWMARTLDGAVFNTMRRITALAQIATSWDSDRGRAQADLPIGGGTDAPEAVPSVTDVLALLNLPELSLPDPRACGELLAEVGTDPDLAHASLLAQFEGTVHPHAHLWARFSRDETARLLALCGAHRDRVRQIVEAALIAEGAATLAA